MSSMLVNEFEDTDCVLVSALVHGEHFFDEAQIRSAKAGMKPEGLYSVTITDRWHRYCGKLPPDCKPLGIVVERASGTQGALMLRDRAYVRCYKGAFHKLNQRAVCEAIGRVALEISDEVARAEALHATKQLEAARYFEHRYGVEYWEGRLLGVARRYYGPLVCSLDQHRKYLLQEIRGDVGERWFGRGYREGLICIDSQAAAMALAESHGGLPIHTGPALGVTGENPYRDYECIAAALSESYIWKCQHRDSPASDGNLPTVHEFLEAITQLKNSREPSRILELYYFHQIPLSRIAEAIGRNEAYVADVLERTNQRIVEIIADLRSGSDLPQPTAAGVQRGKPT